MKNLKMTALLAFSILIITSCTKESPVCCALPYSPYISADKNGDNWHAVAAGLSISNDSLAIRGAQTEEQLIMRIKFNGTGHYDLQNKATFFTTVGQDVVTSEYGTDATAVNSLDITEYNAADNIIVGTYNLSLKKDSHYPNEAYPVSMKFVNGKFSVKLPK
ncbi:DUF6252 family protein [Mucilaginibacter segetis]|uniref:Lipid-binding hydrolase n=1 Tax=Mucilaginibacter segetis TaxID=2793071 RepID=A0A934UPS7_9SPHI|nr:DUF6252 family protein [Mucilaginibacter segetis]MBK0381277.1 hypothetical protein [Mucilaginibacter segetis]